MEIDWIKMSNPLVMQGNSYCIRIPKNVVEQMKAKEGELIAAKVQKLPLELNKEILEKYVSMMKKYVNFSDIKLNAIAVLSWNESMALMELNRPSLVAGKATRKSAEKIMKTYQKYMADIKKEFGKEFYNDYLKASEALQAATKEENTFRED